MPEFDSTSFEDLAEINGKALWSAKDLSQVLGYASYKTFEKGPISKAMTACMEAGIDCTENFHIDQELRLTRFACYMIAINADPKKPEVAKAQAYFATVAQDVATLADVEEVKRVYIRSEVKDRYNGLSATAQSHGVEDFVFFMNAGYRGMYNMDIQKLRILKKAPRNRSPLDFMGPRELAANLFRFEETKVKITHENVRGQQKLEQSAAYVGRQVREIMRENSGQYPEDIEPTDDIKHSHKRLKAANKGFKKLDTKSG